MNKTLEEQLKTYIKKRYGDVKSFAHQANIPNPTLSSMFTRGLLNSNIKNVILIAKALGISVDGLVVGKIIPCAKENNNMNFYNTETYTLLDIYNNLNNEGQKILMANAEFLNSQPQYKKHNPISEKEEISQEIC